MWEVGEDVQALIDCFINLGLKWDGSKFTGGLLSQPDCILNCKNSGTALRFLIGQIATCDFEVTLDGDASLDMWFDFLLISYLALPFFFYHLILGLQL